VKIPVRKHPRSPRRPRRQIRRCEQRRGVVPRRERPREA